MRGQRNIGPIELIIHLHQIADIAADRERETAFAIGGRAALVATGCQRGVFKQGRRPTLPQDSYVGGCYHDPTRDSGRLPEYGNQARRIGCADRDFGVGL